MGFCVIGVRDAWAAFEEEKIRASVAEYLDLGEVPGAPHPEDVR